MSTNELAVRPLRREHRSLWRRVYLHALSSWRVAAHRVRNRLILQFLEMAQRLEHIEARAIAREEAARRGRRPWVLGAPLPTPRLPHTGAVSYRGAQLRAAWVGPATVSETVDFDDLPTAVDHPIPDFER